MYTSVYLCISLHTSVYLCIPLYISAYYCIHLYLTCVYLNVPMSQVGGVQDSLAACTDKQTEKFQAQVASVDHLRDSHG